MAGTGRSAKMGFWLKNGTVLQEQKIQNCCLIRQDHYHWPTTETDVVGDEARVLTLAYGNFSEHPLAQAVLSC